MSDANVSPVSPDNTDTPAPESLPEIDVLAVAREAAEENETTAPGDIIEYAAMILGARAIERRLRATVKLSPTLRDFEHGDRAEILRIARAVKYGPLTDADIKTWVLPAYVAPDAEIYGRAVPGVRL